ncbi:T9SS type A sorting domain-containing protein [Bacteroidota bacterium]
MKINKLLLVFVILFYGFQSIVLCQTYIDVNINQPEPLKANAGQDTTIKPGTSIQLGGNPAAEGGNIGYTYKWSPSSGLDDLTSSNPIATPFTNITYTLVITDKNECTASDDIQITLNTGNNINNKIIDHPYINIYPNPAKNSIYIELKNLNTKYVNITLYSSLGKIIYQHKYYVFNKIELLSEINNLVPGLYFIQIENDNISLSEKIIIE